MNNRFLLITFLLFVAFFAGSEAYMASREDDRLMHSPIAPMSGRKAEANFYSMLNNSGREYRGWIRDGRNYLARREFEQAIWAFRKAIKLQPAAEEARFLLAWTYEKRGLEGLPGDSTDWDALAIKEYTAAIELADHLPARYNLALLHRRHDRFSEARRHLEHIVMIDTRSGLARRAKTELSALFAQDMRPRSISTTFRDSSNE
jgi:tetratricopeptide (TPR) repeat protein